MVRHRPWTAGGRGGACAARLAARALRGRPERSRRGLRDRPFCRLAPGSRARRDRAGPLPGHAGRAAAPARRDPGNRGRRRRAARADRGGGRGAARDHARIRGAPRGGAERGGPRRAAGPGRGGAEPLEPRRAIPARRPAGPKAHTGRGEGREPVRAPPHGSGRRPAIGCSHCTGRARCSPTVSGPPGGARPSGTSSGWRSSCRRPFVRASRDTDRRHLGRGPFAGVHLGLDDPRRGGARAPPRTERERDRGRDRVLGRGDGAGVAPGAASGRLRGTALPPGVGRHGPGGRSPRRPPCAHPAYPSRRGAGPPRRRVCCAAATSWPSDWRCTISRKASPWPTRTSRRRRSDSWCSRPSPCTTSRRGSPWPSPRR